MRLSVRLSISLVLGVALVSMAFALYQTQSERHGLKRELERHATELAESLERSVAPLVVRNSYRELQRMLDRFGNHEHLAGIVVYDAQNRPLAMTSNLAARLKEPPAPVERTIQLGSSNGEFSTLAGEPVHIIALPIRVDSIVLGALAILHDAGYIETRSAAMLQRRLATVVVQTVLIVAVTLLMLRWGLGQPLQHLAAWLRELRTGAVTGSARLPEDEVFKPLGRGGHPRAGQLAVGRAGAREAG